MKINNSPPKNPKDKAKLFTIENEYINKLKSIDSRVQNNYKGQRLYYKSDLEVGEGINYYVPLSSAKESQKRSPTNQYLNSMVIRRKRIF